MTDEAETLGQTVMSSQAGTQTVRATAGSRSTVLPRIQLQGQQLEVITGDRRRFEELEPLGRGGMGEVVLAKDHDIERTVAVKRLPPSCDVDLVARFVDEVRTVGQLDHPNIVPVHDVGVDDAGRYYFVMKHLRGETLEALINRLRSGDRAAHARYNFTARLQLFIGVLNAIECAHKQGIIHRDLKPANIMVGPFGEVTVMDWGLARRVGGAEVPSSGSRAGTPLQTMTGALLGTPLYMAPEQARGDNAAVDQRTDTYALSVMLYELLYLTHPLEGRTAIGDILDGVKTFTPNLMTGGDNPHQPGVPPELGWYLDHGLKKDPAARFQSAREMIDELQRILRGEIHVQCPRTFTKRMLNEYGRFVDRRPNVAVGLFGVLGVFALFGVVRLFV